VKWVISSGGKTFREDTDTKITVGVDKPITATAYYEPWHRILISGGPASPVISGCTLEGNDAWCREGSLVTIDLPTTTVGFLLTQEFKSWIIETVGGRSMSENKSITFHITSPVKLTAMWAYNYTQLIIIITSVATLTAPTLYLFSRRKGLGMKTRPIDYIKYTVCPNCNSIPPYDYEGDTCPNCNHKIVTKLIPTKCPKCGNELGTIAFPPPPEIRCKECGFLISLNKE
jgi:hypothetical protein